MTTDLIEFRAAGQPIFVDPFEVAAVVGVSATPDQQAYTRIALKTNSVMVTVTDDVMSVAQRINAARKQLAQST